MLKAPVYKEWSMARMKPHNDGFGVKADRHLDSPSSQSRPHERADGHAADSRSPDASTRRRNDNGKDDNGGFGDAVNSFLGRNNRAEKLAEAGGTLAQWGGYAALAAGFAYGSMELLDLARRTMSKYLTGVDPDAAASANLEAQKKTWEEKAVRLDQPGMQAANGKLAGIAGQAGINLPGQPQSEGGKSVSEGKVSSLGSTDTKTFVVGQKDPAGKGDQGVIALSTGAGRETLSAYSQSSEEGIARKRNFVSELPEGSVKIGPDGVQISAQADKALQIGKKSMQESPLEASVSAGNRETDVMTMLNREGRVTKEARFSGREGHGAVEISEGRAVFSQLDQYGKPTSSREVKDPGISVSPETGVESLPKNLQNQIGAFASDPSKFPEGLQLSAADKVMEQAKAMNLVPMSRSIDLRQLGPARDHGLSR
ncbi:hypothetical protein IC232_03725 [Microvirga sp. BT688]|uniref:hypothetical protein n=1 Tax=Microvirga sp. TaxID=1873136 RepID=UPI001687B0F1|nr:hypothetical protein [Microvirga sp.]MBD2745800.1 hypothetical protein [Microvirga sp.]